MSATKGENNEETARRMKEDADSRFNKLRRVAHDPATIAKSHDQIAHLQGNAKLHYVNVPSTRAYYLIKQDSWLYLERANDGSSSTLYVVRRLPNGQLLTRTLNG
ncbi:hypothetical protein AB6A40_009669 [Gnathostoma spinigerum]|uniref:Uncharacterized protein n=1 Tax=Gnathostoma spinigerum TaxID=75299 RepID=A0ABD6ETV8_9BILA